MGYIEFVVFVIYIWYFKGVFLCLGYLFDMVLKDFEKVIYFVVYMVILVDEEVCYCDLGMQENNICFELKMFGDCCDLKIVECLVKLEEEFVVFEVEGVKVDVKKKVKDVVEKEMFFICKGVDEQIVKFECVWEDFCMFEVGVFCLEDDVFYELQDCFGQYFEVYMGVELIQCCFVVFDFEVEVENLCLQILEGKGQCKICVIKCFKVVSLFFEIGMSFVVMVLDVVLVILLEFCLMVQFDGGCFVISDLNDLYCCVINCNNCFCCLIDFGVFEIIVNNEKCMLQEVVDVLFDNGCCGCFVIGIGNCVLKFFSDMLKGKQGCFCQNLFGKCVDYFGCLVIIVGLQLKLYQCGLFKQMVLEFFKLFVIKCLIDFGYLQNIKVVKCVVECICFEVWDVFEEIICECLVLFNCVFIL